MGFQADLGFAGQQPPGLSAASVAGGPRIDPFGPTFLTRVRGGGRWARGRQHPFEVTKNQKKIQAVQAFEASKFSSF